MIQKKLELNPQAVILNNKAVGCEERENNQVNMQGSY